MRAYAELWGRDPKTLDGWCRKGSVPGTFKHGSGEWWVRPLELIEFDRDQMEDKATLDVRPRLRLGQRPEKLRHPGE